MNDPLEAYYSAANAEELRPEFEASLHRKLFEKRQSWLWVFSPAMIAYLLILVSSSLPGSSPKMAAHDWAASDGIEIANLSLMGRRR